MGDMQGVPGAYAFYMSTVVGRMVCNLSTVSINFCLQFLVSMLFVFVHSTAKFDMSGAL